VREIKWLRWVVWVFLFTGATIITVRLLPVSVRQPIMSRYLSPGASGSLFWVWLLALSFSQAVFNRDLRPRWRAALGVLVLVTLYVTFKQNWAWNSGWMPALVSLSTIVLVAFPRLGLVGLLGGVLAAAPRIQQIVSAIMVGDNSYSLSTRLEAWDIVWGIAKVSPILGLGPANYYWYTALFPIRGWAVQFNSHNQYVDLIAQTGILGLVCFVWFFGAVGWVAWRLRHRVKPGFSQAYVYAALGGVAGTLAAAAFGDWVIPFFYNITVGGFRASMLSWLFLGGLVALEQIYAGQRSDETAD
jgi:O-antigen ligase